MAKMKKLTIYLLLFIALYVVSQLLINAYIKTSYHKIDKYDISEDQLTITIDRTETRSSRDDGYIVGKISNRTNEKSAEKYMKIELYSEKNVNLGEEYVKLEPMEKNDIKDFKVRFTCDNVKSFKITFLTPEQKAEIDAKKDKSIIPNLNHNEDVEQIINSIESNR